METERTFDDLWALSATRGHFSHIHDFYTERFRRTLNGTTEYHANWNAIEEYYHRAVDPRCFEPA